MGRMKGVVTVNETTGYLFMEEGTPKFAYRNLNGIVVDEFRFLDRLRLKIEDTKIMGAQLSGKQSGNRYSTLESVIPQIPILESITRENLRIFDGQVVKHNNNLCVVIQDTIFYRGIEAGYTIEGLTGQKEEDVMKNSIFIPPENPIPETVLPCIYLIEFMEQLDDPALKRMIEEFERKLDEISEVKSSDMPDFPFQSFLYPGSVEYQYYDKILRRNGLRE